MLLLVEINETIHQIMSSLNAAYGFSSWRRSIQAFFVIVSGLCSVMLEQRKKRGPMDLFRLAWKFNEFLARLMTAFPVEVGFSKLFSY